MPRYFFHVIDGEELRDAVGTELAGVPEARAEAIVVSGEMLRDLGGSSGATGNGKSAWRTKPETRFAPSRSRLTPLRLARCLPSLQDVHHAPHFPKAIGDAGRHRGGWRSVLWLRTKL
jgi:hypothetical protein